LLEKLQYELVELKLLIGELEDDLPRNHPWRKQKKISKLNMKD
jgi:hypothetical protein